MKYLSDGAVTGEGYFLSKVKVVGNWTHDTSVFKIVLPNGLFYQFFVQLNSTGQSGKGHSEFTFGNHTFKNADIEIYCKI